MESTPPLQQTGGPSTPSIGLKPVGVKPGIVKQRNGQKVEAVRPRGTRKQKLSRHPPQPGLSINRKVLPERSLERSKVYFIGFSRSTISSTRRVRNGGKERYAKYALANAQVSTSKTIGVGRRPVRRARTILCYEKHDGDIIITAARTESSLQRIVRPTSKPGEEQAPTYGSTGGVFGTPARSPGW
jgi:hypothetical protein